MHSHVEGMACSETCPAFAIVETGEPEDFTDFKAPEYAANMTLRDHFAGLAMVHLMSVYHWVDEPDRVMAEISTMAFVQADAMMAAREVKRG